MKTSAQLNLQLCQRILTENSHVMYKAQIYEMLKLKWTKESNVPLETVWACVKSK